MSTSTKLLPLVERGCKSAMKMSFHTTSRRLARMGLSPRVKAANRTPRQTAPVARKVFDSSTFLPPLQLLNSARKSSVLEVEPEVALEFLRGYMTQYQVARTSDGKWEKELCAENGITPPTMSLLASILMRCINKEQRALAKWLFLSASALGDRSATYELISNALHHEKLADYPAQIQQLGLLAKRDNDPKAMTLLGQVLFSQRREKEALVWLRKATNPPNGSLEFDGAGDALLLEGRILLKAGDKRGARAVLEKAALELDDPNAYFYLSKLQESGAPEEKIYCLKAASSGIIEACHNMGALELAGIEKNGKRPSSMADYGMAREWFQVAATDGFGLSMLNLAMMSNAVGDHKQRFEWLDKAEDVAETSHQAGVLRKQWGESSQKSI